MEEIPDNVPRWPPVQSGSRILWVKGCDTELLR